MQKVTLLLSAIALLSVTACKTTKPIRPVESYQEENRFERRVSEINIPIQLDITELERSLNRQLTGILYEDDTFEDGDKMKVRAEKDGEIGIQVAGMAITYQIPLKLWIQYNLGIGRVEAEGNVNLEFRTAFAISPEWNMTTNTVLEGHQWTERPRVRVGVVRLPVESIANIIIRRSEETIGQSIDGLVEEAFHLAQYVQDAWQQMFVPYQVSEEYQTWLLVNPRDIGMTPIETREDQMTATIVVRSQPELRFGPEPAAEPVLALPAFSFRPPDPNSVEGFSIYVEATLSYADAERLTRQSLLGQRFEQGRRHVVVENIELFGQGNNLIVNLQLSGSYNGSIYLSGEPVFNPNRNRIEIEDLEYTLDTKNFLLRSASWLIQGTLKRKLQENMDYLLDYNLQDAQRQMQEQLNGYEVAPGVTLDGSLSTLDLHNAYLTTDGIKVAIQLTGDAEILIDGLQDFGLGNE